jgi:uncharacterized protein
MAVSRFPFKHIVLQPTTLCNLNCEYCYLPDKHEANKMYEGVAEAVAESIKDSPHAMTILWHGGEPLASGIDHLKRLLEPFEPMRLAGKVEHNIQINGTMISPDWCRLFRDKNFSVGISIDGPEGCNVNRINRANMPAWERIMKGIGLLKLNRIPFGVIAVVSDANIESPAAFYKFFSSLGCRNLCVNIVESEGMNKERNHLDKDAVRNFWRDLFGEWKADPKIKIREFDKSLGWLGSAHAPAGNGSKYVARDMWPTIAWNGDVVMLSPEFLSVEHGGRKGFIVGNILDKPLDEIVKDSFSAGYVRDYFSGIEKCSKECAYFAFCGGGQASNKFFELDKIDATVTEECRNTRMLLLDSVRESLSPNGNDDTGIALKTFCALLPEELAPEGFGGFNADDPSALVEEGREAQFAGWSDWSDREGV